MRNSTWAGRFGGLASLLVFFSLLVSCASDDSAGAAHAGLAAEPDPSKPAQPAAPTAIEVPNPLPSLGAVWGSASSDVWAVGSEGVMIHYDGTRWAAAQSPTKAPLLGIHGIASDDIWAVGDDVILHWDGNEWSVKLENISEALLAVWVVASDDVWIAGIDKETHHGLLRHWNGQEFGRGVFGGAASVWELWAGGPGDVWMAGTKLDDTEAGFVAHGNVDLVSPTHEYAGAALRSLWGLDSNDIWFVPYTGAFQHWDGTAFTEFPGDPDAKLLGISGTAPDDIWAVGLHGAIMHWDGQAWTHSETSTDTTLWSVWAPHPDDAWAVGGTLLHWNGEHWSDVGMPQMR